MNTLTNDTFSALVSTFVDNLAVTDEHTLTIGQFHGQFVAEFGKMPSGKGTAERKLWKRAYRHARVAARKAVKLEGKRTTLRVVGTRTTRSSGRHDIFFAGKEFTFGEAKRFVERCNGVFDVAALLKAITDHGFTSYVLCEGTFAIDAPKPVEKPAPVVDVEKVKADLAKLQAKAAKDAAKMKAFQESLDALNAGTPAMQAEVRETVATEVSTPPVAETPAEPKVETPAPKASKKAKKAA
jgi:hypothetical protein